MERPRKADSLLCLMSYFWWYHPVNGNQILLCKRGFPGGSDGKESACNAGDLGSIPGSGRSPGEGNGYPLQYSCLERSLDRGAWWAQAIGLQRIGRDWVTNTHTPCIEDTVSGLVASKEVHKILREQQCRVSNAGVSPCLRCLLKTFLRGGGICLGLEANILFVIFPYSRSKYMSGECNLLGSVSSKRRFEATDDKALDASQLLDSPCYSSRTAQFYLENKGKYILEAWGQADPKGAKRREREKIREKKREPRPFGSCFYVFSPPPGPALCKLGWPRVLFALPEVLTPVLGTSFVLFSWAFPFLAL